MGDAPAVRALLPAGPEVLVLMPPGTFALRLNGNTDQGVGVRRGEQGIVAEFTSTRIPIGQKTPKVFRYPSTRCRLTEIENMPNPLCSRHGTPRGMNVSFKFWNTRTFGRKISAVSNRGSRSILRRFRGPSLDSGRDAGRAGSRRQEG